MVVVGIFILLPNNVYSFATVNSPLFFEAIEFSPVEVEIQLSEGTDVATFAAWLNGADVSGSFTYDAAGRKMTATLGPESGLKILREPSGGFNVIKTTISDFRGSSGGDSVLFTVNSRSLTRETDSGLVKGDWTVPGHLWHWKGIPYAKPPVGELRWKAPRDPEPWEGVKLTTEYGNRAFQPDGSWSTGAFTGDENSLYLNVWRPATAEVLPVFFWIHGGSNTGGSGQGSWYTMAYYYNCVVVSINYRTGALGWFSHPALETGDSLDDSGNYGTLDQIKALEWVRDNIANFGGDPDNVTLAGESAGAQNVSYLMHSPLAEGLFQKALIESNYPGIRPVSAAYKSSKQVLYNLIVSDATPPYDAITDAAAAKAHVEANMTDAQISQYLTGKTAGDITDAYFDGGWGTINWGDFSRDDITSWWQTQNRPEFIYCIGDGAVLPDDIDFADFSEGHVFPTPAIIGTTKNENNLWNAYWPFNYEPGKSLDQLAREFVDADPSYGATAEEFKQNYKFATELIDELDIYLGAQLSARNLASGGAVDNIYVYRFDWGSDPNKTYNIPFEDAYVAYLGAPHGAEMDFFHLKFFGLAEGDSAEAHQYTEENLAGRQALSFAIWTYLKEFINNKDGSIPKTDDQPVLWEPWSASNEGFIVFDADFQEADVEMNTTDIYRTPQEIYDAHLAHENGTVRDFIEYYVLWSWHWNWFPNSSVGIFDPAPGPNSLFDPSNP